MKTLSLAAGAILLAGCAAAPTSTVTVTAPAPSTITAPAPAPDYSSQGEQIRDLLSSQGFPYSGSARSLEELAESICGALDAGLSAALLVEVAMDNGFTMEQGASLVAASIIVTCPRHRSAV